MEKRTAVILVIVSVIVGLSLPWIALKIGQDVSNWEQEERSQRFLVCIKPHMDYLDEKLRTGKMSVQVHDNYLSVAQQGCLSMTEGKGK